MDPISAVGTVGGLVTLAFDVYDNCVRLFKFLGALVDMPKDCEKYRLQLIMEYNRVLAWGQAAGLVDVEEGSSLGAALGTHSTELIAVIARIQWLLEEFRDINARYATEIPDSNNEKAEILEAKATDVDLVKQVSSLAVSYEKKRKERRYRRGTNHIRSFFEQATHNVKEVVTHPRRIRWVAVDQEAFQGLLQDLHVLTNRLHELMGDYREKRIDETTAKTYREMILARNDVHELKSMLDAVTELISLSSDAPGSTPTGLLGSGKQLGSLRNHKTLQDLVRIKNISRTSELIMSQHVDGNLLNIESTLSDMGVTVKCYTKSDFDEQFVWNEEDVNQDLEHLLRPTGSLTTERGEIPVWIEWKSLGDLVPDSAMDKQSRLRTIAIAEMLHSPKPHSLCAPTCVGYFDDRELSGEDRYGWIFAMPDGCDFDSCVVPLYSLLGQGQHRPTLTQRVSLAAKLASSLLVLHSVNWLHKGVFSENVLFCFKGARYDPEQPILSGFEYSRPESGNTTWRHVDVQWDLYRWPGIQREAPREANSRKTYDVYSLGLLLLEIAHWRPLVDLLHIGSANGSASATPKTGNGTPATTNVRLKDSKMVRAWLLGEEGGAPFGAENPVEQLRHVVGERYYRAVKRCLWAYGEMGFGIEEAADQAGDPEAGLLLQDAFTAYVVDELKLVDV